MIETHRTFIGKCAPLAEKIIEIVTLKSLNQMLGLQIQLPFLPLLTKVQSQIFREGKTKVRMPDKCFLGSASHEPLNLRPVFSTACQKKVLDPVEHFSNTKTRNGLHLWRQDCRHTGTEPKNIHKRVK